MSRRALLIVVMSCLLTLSLGGLAYAASVEFIEDDWETRGDWMGKYGTIGWAFPQIDVEARYGEFVEDISEAWNFPDFMQLELVHKLPTEFFAPVCSFWYMQEFPISDESELLHPDFEKWDTLLTNPHNPNERFLCQWENSVSFRFTLVIPEDETYELSLYLADYDEFRGEGARYAIVEIGDATTNEILDVREYPDHTEGVWVRYRVTGSIFITMINGNLDDWGAPIGNVTLCAMLFD